MELVGTVKQKKIHIEFLRILAAFFVIFNHTDYKGYFLFSLYPTNSAQFWVYIFPAIFCKFTVQLFFAISGALLLTKEESLKDIYLKRVLRIFIILVVFSFAYYLFTLGMTHDFASFSVGSFFKILYSTMHNYSFWFLYAYIPFLMALPLLRSFVKHLEDKYFIYMIILAIIFTAVIPIVEYLLWHGTLKIRKDFGISWILSNCVIYPCVGYYLENRLDINKIKKYIPYLWIANIVAIAISCFMTYYKARLTGVCNEETTQTFVSSFVLVNVITLFITAKWMFNRKVSPGLAKVILSVGDKTLGIYLFHLMMMTLLVKTPFLDFMRETLHMNYMISILIFCVVAFLMGYVATFLLKLIPGVKKYL